MVLKKAISAAICTSLLISSTSVFAGELNSTNTEQPPAYNLSLPDATNLQSKIMMVEEEVYGHYMTGPLLDRIASLETEFYGKVSTNLPIDNRINRLYDTLFSNSPRPSVVTQLNGIEWFLSHQVSNNSLIQRITNLENNIYGKPQTGSLQHRMNQLAVLAYGSGTKTPLVQAEIPADTLVKIKLVTPLNSQTAKVGQKVRFQAAEDVISNGVLIIPAGAPGIGVVTKVKEAKNFGRNGEINVNFQQIQTFDGSNVPTVLGDKAQQEIRHLAYAAGASIASMALLGPIGIVGGIFVHGKNIDLPAGTESYIQTKSAQEIYGIKTDLADNLVVKTPEVTENSEEGEQPTATNEEATTASTATTPKMAVSADDKNITAPTTTNSKTKAKDINNNIYDYEY